MWRGPSPVGVHVIRRSSFVLVLLSLLASLSVTVSAPVAYAGPGESDLVSRINSERSSRGRRAYSVRSDLTSVARNHASRMAARRSIYHNPNLGSEVRNWRSLAENVGKGSDARSIHNAFMGSSSHRANILSSTYTEVGVGTAVGGDGLLYVVEIFRLPAGATYSPPPASRTTVRAPAPAPRRTTAPRASRSSRRPAPTAPRPVDPRVLLRARLAQASAYDRRANPQGLLSEISTYHAVIRTLAAHA